MQLCRAPTGLESLSWNSANLVAIPLWTLFVVASPLLGDVPLMARSKLGLSPVQHFRPNKYQPKVRAKFTCRCHSWGFTTEKKTTNRWDIQTVTNHWEAGRRLILTTKIVVFFVCFFSGSTNGWRNLTSGLW